MIFSDALFKRQGIGLLFSGDGVKSFSDDSKWYLMLITPAMLLLIGFTFGPFLYSIYLSLHNWTLISSGDPEFIGFDNFVALVKDQRFFGALWVTAVMLFFCLSIQLTLGTFIALLLHGEYKAGKDNFSGKKGQGNGAGKRKNILRTLFLLPMMVTPIVAALMWQMMLNNEYGAVSHLLSVIGVEKAPIWLGDPKWALFTIILVDTWQWTPMVILFVMAGLNAVPIQYYEAAEVEGARPFQVFVHIVLPFLRPIFVLVGILRGMDIVKMFDILFVLTKGGPGTSTETMTYFTYRQGFSLFHMGYAATLSLVILFLIIILSQRAIKFFKADISMGEER